MPKPKRERQVIDGKVYTKPKRGKPRLLCRNMETMTESEFWGMFKSMLRSGTKYWKPKLEYLNSKSRPYKGTNKRIKTEYQCEACNQWYVRAKIEVNHKVPVGGIASFEDIGIVAKKLYLETLVGWEVLCKECHLLCTKQQRQERQNVGS
jgi:hypothetical protein